MPNIEVKVVHQAPGLPYSASYAEWREHIERAGGTGCGQCQDALRTGMLGMPFSDSPSLCDTGADIDIRMHQAIVFQKQSSELN